MVYRLDIEDEQHDLVDIEWFCTLNCAYEYRSSIELERAYALDLFGLWPTSPDETDYDLHCAGCHTLLQRGIEETS